MATPAADLRNKLKLEAKLRPKIKAYNEKLIREFRRQYKFDGNILNVGLFEDELNAILADHYQETASIFSNRIIPDLPDDVPATDEETDLIASSLAIYFMGQSQEAAKAINNTNKNDLIASVNEAGEDEMTDGLIGREKIIVTATLAAAFAARKLNARVGTIAVTETQFGAETAKATEAEVLSGLRPSITDGASTQKVTVKKTWWTVGDSAVRPAHIQADGQERDLNKPYRVGGELLNHPRDTSLGASIGNVIRCRCNSQPSEDDIIEVRRSAMDIQKPVPKPPKPITEPSKPPKPKPPASPSRPVTPKPKPTPVVEPIKVDDFQDPPASPVRAPSGEFVTVDSVTKTGKITAIETKNLKNYSFESYKGINSFMRNPNKFHESVVSELKGEVRSIRKAITKGVIKENVVVYRGTNSNKVGSAFSTMKKGDKLPIVQFQSTTTRKTVAETFAIKGKEDRIVLKINLKKGTKGLNLDQFKQGLSGAIRSEQEILLSDSGEYIFKGMKKEITEFGEKIKVVELDYSEIKSVKAATGIKIDESSEEIEMSVPAVQRMYFSEQEMFYSLLKNNDYEILESFLDG